MTAVTYPHIEVDDHGVARFGKTRFKVVHVAAAARRGWPVEEIRAAHPDLTPAQIHSALAYYYDHQAETDAQIEQDEQEYQRRWEENQDSPIRKKLVEFRKQREQ